MSTETFVPFNYEGIEEIELWDHGVQTVPDADNVVIRVTLTSGGPPEASIGVYGPRGGWYGYRPGGDLAELAAAVLKVRKARDLVEELEPRWDAWMDANGYSR
jgi:hypothetical protein